MSNLTIAVDEHIIKQARVRAIQQVTSVSAKVREFLASYVNGSAPNLTTEPSSDLIRLMAQVRDEIRHSSAQVDAPDQAAPSHPALTLRDQMYQGDFRARDRLPTAQDTALHTNI
ncbi:MAG: hypothetical protein PHH58_17400 [Rhodoferax sp.]|nr:hypothetical protein [Rhodoferax sp.]